MTTEWWAVRVPALSVGLLVGTIIVKWGFMSPLTLHNKQVQNGTGWQMKANYSMMLYAAKSAGHACMIENYNTVSFLMCYLWNFNDEAGPVTYGSHQYIL